MPANKVVIVIHIGQGWRVPKNDSDWVRMFKVRNDTNPLWYKLTAHGQVHALPSLRGHNCG